ncbi:hypothetical protein HF086_001712 [Spodoptera exigua]|uniref:Uncharacterized protein n=1 Tax=Spodoptera exigua TaxID=7107 RepID=A0A922MN73_SPOEX|nr:hypothetical protein HF086_001712 [Spodoptera exigua]
MENLDNNADRVASAVPQVRSSPRKRRVRSRSSSSSSSSCPSFESSSSTSGGSPKISRRNKKRGGKRKRLSERKFRKLTKEVRNLHRRIASQDSGQRVSTNLDYDAISLMSNINENSYEQMLDVEPSSFSASGDQEFTLSLETKLKEPSMPKAPENYIQLLCDYQHLGKSDWNEIRYSETQKLYNYSPGYTDIEMNEEVKAFESPRHLVHADKAFAALTMCVLKQRDALQGTLQELLQWARNSVSLSYDTLLQKVSDLFSTGDYSRCSSDLLQIICGHRAEILQMRRDCVTKQAKDPLMKARLKKIPPTCTNLFNAEKFTAAIEKSGGVRKCFWPLQKGNTSSASQADLNKFRGPSQGSKPYNKSLQGFSRNAQACQHITTHSQCVGSDPPSQGGCSHSNPPPQGESNPRGHAAQYNSVAPNNRSNFRGRPNARQNNQSKHVRKRALCPQRNNDNKRRKY